MFRRGNILRNVFSVLILSSMCFVGVSYISGATAHAAYEDLPTYLFTDKDGYSAYDQYISPNPDNPSTGKGNYTPTFRFLLYRDIGDTTSSVRIVNSTTENKPACSDFEGSGHRLNRRVTFDSPASGQTHIDPDDDNATSLGCSRYDIGGGFTLNGINRFTASTRFPGKEVTLIELRIREGISGVFADVQTVSNQRLSYVGDYTGPPNTANGVSLSRWQPGYGKVRIDFAPPCNYNRSDPVKIFWKDADAGLDANGGVEVTYRLLRDGRQIASGNAGQKPTYYEREFTARAGSKYTMIFDDVRGRDSNYPANTIKVWFPFDSASAFVDCPKTTAVRGCSIDIDGTGPIEDSIESGKQITADVDISAGSSTKEPDGIPSSIESGAGTTYYLKYETYIEGQTNYVKNTLSSFKESEVKTVNPNLGNAPSGRGNYTIHAKVFFQEDTSGSNVVYNGSQYDGDRWSDDKTYDDFRNFFIECTKAVSTWQQFNSNPSVSLNTFDPENPTDVIANASIADAGTAADAPVQSGRLKITRNGTEVVGRDVTAGDVGTTIDVGPLTKSNSNGLRSAPDNWGVGDTICATLEYNWKSGWIGPGGVLTGQSPGYVSTGCPIITNRPYVSVYGNDVSAGGGFGTCAVSPNDTIKSYIKSGRGGSGTQLAAFALDEVNGFRSASMRISSNPIQPDGLTFGHVGGGQLGHFGVLDCAKDYYTNAAFPNGSDKRNPTNDTIDSSSFSFSNLENGGQTHIAGDLTLSGDTEFDKRHTIFVDGDVTISDDISYADTGGWANINSIPYFSLIVKGNIIIGPGVERLDGLYIAQPESSVTGNIFTCATNASPRKDGRDLWGQCRSRLTVYGSFIAENIHFMRVIDTLSDGLVAENAGSSRAAEVFRFSPEIYLGEPVFRRTSTSTTGEYDYITTLPPIL